MQSVIVLDEGSVVVGLLGRKPAATVFWAAFRVHW